MKVLLINGSPNKEGCTYTALREVGIHTPFPLSSRGGENPFFRPCAVLST